MNVYYGLIRWCRYFPYTMISPAASLMYCYASEFPFVFNTVRSMRT